MPPETPRAKRDRRVVQPIAPRGLDQWCSREVVHEDCLVAASGVRLDKRDVRRRQGMQLGQALANVQDTTGALVIADATDYAHAPWHAAQEFDIGPWAIFFHYKAHRPAGNPANHTGVCMMLREVADGTHRSSYGFELKADGTFAAHFSRNSDGTKYTCSTATTNDAIEDGFLFWDPKDGATGRLSLYLNDALATSVTGPGADAIPLRSASARLTFGQTASGAIPATLEADTSFAGGTLDSFCAMTWPGRSATALRANGRSLIDTCRRFARQGWPNPLECAWYYGFDGNGNDLSWSANHATVVGAPAYAARLEYPLCMGQHVVAANKTNGSRELLVVSGGRIFSMPLKAAQ